jgi:hypothetical protein
MEYEVLTLLDALEEIERRGYFDHAWDWFDIGDSEEYEREDYEAILHNVIPEVIMDIANDAGVYVYNIYHLKDDVKMPEYIVLLEWDGERYTIELDIVDCTIYIVDGMKGWVEIPPYYHPIYPL